MHYANDLVYSTNHKVENSYLKSTLLIALENAFIDINVVTL